MFRFDNCDKPFVEDQLWQTDEINTDEYEDTEEVAIPPVQEPMFTNFHNTYHCLTRAYLLQWKEKCLEHETLKGFA